MADATIIDGRAIAADLRAKVKTAAAAFAAQTGMAPGLAVVLVGENPASQVYVRNKKKQAGAAGLNSSQHLLPVDTTQATLLALISKLNAEPTVHGILVQLPLPAQIDPGAVLEAIDPDRDVDGFHPINVGRLSTGRPGLVPCTPQGCILLLKSALGHDLSGKEAVVVGRSNIVGKPLSQLLLAENCTVTIAHSRTRDLATTCARADILVAAVGRPGLVRGQWVKAGATVIDVAMNRLPAREAGGKNRLVGDVAFDEAKRRAAFITPVPGGVGPMTIACLLANTVAAAHRQAGLVAPDFGCAMGSVGREKPGNDRPNRR